MERFALVNWANISSDGDIDLSILEPLGELSMHEVPAGDPDALVEVLQGVPYAVISQHVMFAELFERCPDLKFVNITSTGYEKITKEIRDSAREHGAVICNIPSYGTAAVAQTTVALLLELCNSAGALSADVKAGEWLKRPRFT